MLQGVWIFDIFFGSILHCTSFLALALPLLFGIGVTTPSFAGEHDAYDLRLDLPLSPLFA
jgi:hypothetical protein